MSTKASKFHGRIEGAAAHCAVPGCRTAGEFRAPLSAGDFDGPGEYLYLCLDHVRAHNARYNYFAGMSADQIEAAQSPIAGWERQTRPFATGGASPGPAPAAAKARVCRSHPAIGDCAASISSGLIPAK